MSKESNPCYGCERRCVKSGYNCHSDCPDYKEFHDKNCERSNIIRKKRGEDAEFKSVRVHSIAKSQKRKIKQTYWKG